MILACRTAERFHSCGDAKMELFDYIEVFYNQRRRHSMLGQISPAESERRAPVAFLSERRTKNGRNLINRCAVLESGDSQPEDR